MKSFVRFILIAALLVTPLFANPVPYIHQPLVPTAKTPGSAGFVLTVHGAGFVSGAVVTWNGSPRATSFVSGKELKATIPATDLAAAGTANVKVVNPGPGGASNVAYFQVVKPLKAVSFSLQNWDAGASIAELGFAVGDFKGDGKADIAATDSHGQVSGKDLLTFPGNGDGTFGSPIYSSYVSPGAFIAADLNNDGKLDLAMIDNPLETVDVFLGNGDGTFTLKGSMPFPGQGYGIVAGDFNGDGNLDLIVSLGGLIEVFLGKGDGSFQSPASYSAPSGAGAVVGDFNGDGKLDLAFPDGKQILVLIGNGDGSFQSPVAYPLSAEAVGLAAADFNGDGILDLAVGYDSMACPACNSNIVSILLGNGDGTFQAQSDYPVDESSDALAAGDFNGDGRLDLCVMGTSAPNNSVGSLLLGNGNGTFQAPLDFYSGGLEGSAGLMTGDFNNDGLLDIATGVLGFGIDVGLGTPAPVGHLSKTKVVFPNQLVGTTSAKVTVTLSNLGSAPLEVIYVTSTGDFAQTNNCPASLSPGSSCVINITFKPAEIGTRTGVITIGDNNDDINGSQQQISLSGTGTVVSLSPSKLTFPPQMVGTTSAAQTVTLTNHSLSAVGINGIGIAGPDKGDFAQTNTCGNVVQARNTCTISVTFTPTAAGARTAKVNVNDTGGGSPQHVSLAGAGQ